MSHMLFLPQHVSSSRVTRWVWEIIWAQVWFLIRGSWGQWAVNCSIGEWAGVIGSRWLSWSRTPRCFVSVWGWRWDGSHAYSGSWEYRAWVESPTLPWAYSAGWLVLGVRAWHSAMLPCISFLPWSSWGADKIVEGTLSARIQCTSSFILTTLMVVQPGGIRRSPGGESDCGASLPVKLPSPDGTTWDFHPGHVSSPCPLVARAYTASGQAAFTLHAMAYLQVYQAKVLKDLHEGDWLCSVEGDVHISGLGAPPVTQPDGYVGCGESSGRSPWNTC